MIELKNVSKKYAAKSKAETVALNGVNLKIGGKGAVVILGKSGSGKSTLLNLLGGLDAPTSGEIIVDGVSMAHFSQKDYDSYRNDRVGFIFQEYNLLNDLNVHDNIALALQLSKDGDVDKKVSDALNSVELSDEYLNRRIGEMSGGEKQRVAIARAIVKDSKIILADEPTGNLDSATGDSVWKILKTLSRDRLVVVVTHDRQSAEKFGDRIIEIADGQIIADTGSEAEYEFKTEGFAANKKRLSLRIRWKMGYNNLRLRKAKTVGVILLTVFGILSLLITQISLSFNSEITLSEYMTQNGVDYFSVQQGYVDERGGFNRTQRIFNNESLRFMDGSAVCIRDGVISEKQDVLDMGLSFVGGALEIDGNSFYITSEHLNERYEYGGMYVIIDGKKTEVVRELHPAEFLIGKQVLTYRDAENAPVLAGVIDTSGLANPAVIPNIITTADFKNVELNNYDEFNLAYDEVYLAVNDSVYASAFGINSDLNGYLTDGGYRSRIIVTSSGIAGSDFVLENNEIILPFAIYAELFGAKSQNYYVESNLMQVFNYPEQLGKTFFLSMIQTNSGEAMVDLGTVKLAGVSFFGEPYRKDTPFITVNESLHAKLQSRLNRWSRVVVKADSVNVKRFVTALRLNYDCYVDNAGYADGTSDSGSSINIDVAQNTYAFEDFMQRMSVFFIAICAVLIVVLILLVINLVSFSVAERKKEIGILSALGASSKDITSVFLFETLIIAAISFVFILALTFAFVFVFNSIMSGIWGFNSVFPYLQFGWLTATVSVAADFGLLSLAAVIPLSKVVKMKPIDAIRNI